MASDLPPLSSTVSAVFDAFIKGLEDGGAIGSVACEALKESLESQKLDHGSLRAAMFKTVETEK